MIFVTVGTQLPFDRLVACVDTWAARNKSEEVLAQVGPSTLFPTNIISSNSLAYDEYQSVFDRADIIISHAGMGTIISALIAKKPLIILPRKASLGEHRNDHQLATCKYFENKKGCHVAWDENNLVSLLDNKNALDTGEFSSSASDDFVVNLRLNLNL